MTAQLLQSPPPPTRLQQFAELVRRHDPTYPFADDARDYAAGAAQRQALIELAVDLPTGEVMAILELRLTKLLTRGADVDSYLRQFAAAVAERQAQR